MVLQPGLLQDPLAFRNLRPNARCLQAHRDEAEVGDGIDLSGGVGGRHCMES